jgi:hypothetical protein
MNKDNHSATPRSGDIDVVEYLDFVRGLEGQQIPTKAGRSAFSVAVSGGEISFTPPSGKRRRTDFRRVLTRYNEVRTLNSHEYHDITWNASYHLALIGRYLQRQEELSAS